MRWEGSRN